MQTLYAKGGRKTATSRAYIALTQGEGKIEINRKKLEAYFSNKVNVLTVKQPLEILKRSEGIDSKTSYNIAVFVKGGGTTGQAESVRHAIARAIAQIGDPYRAIMKSAKLLTRDSRMVESKKPGYRKSRDKKQWTKR